MDEFVHFSNQIDNLSKLKKDTNWEENKKTLKFDINLELSDTLNAIESYTKEELNKLENKVNNLKLLKKQMNTEVINLKNTYIEEAPKHKFPENVYTEYIKLKDIQSKYEINQEKIKKNRLELNEISDKKIKLSKELQYNNIILNDGHKKEMNKLEIQAVKEKKEKILKEKDKLLKNIIFDKNKANNSLKQINNNYSKQLKNITTEKKNKIKNIQNKIDKNLKKKHKTDLEENINNREICILKNTIKMLENEFEEKEKRILEIYEIEKSQQNKILEQLEVQETDLEVDYSFTLSNFEETLEELEKYFSNLYERNQEILTLNFEYRLKEDILEAEILKYKDIKESEMNRIKTKIVKQENMSVQNFNNFKNKYDIKIDELNLKIMKLDNRINGLNLKINKLKIGKSNESLNQRKKYLINLLKKLDKL